MASAAACLRGDGVFCSFSPCIEQVRSRLQHALTTQSVKAVSLLIGCTGSPDMSIDGAPHCVPGLILRMAIPRVHGLRSPVKRPVKRFCQGWDRAPQVQKTAAELAGAGFAAPRTMECLLREYEVGARPATRGASRTGPACVSDRECLRHAQPGAVMQRRQWLRKGLQDAGGWLCPALIATFGLLEHCEYVL